MSDLAKLEAAIEAHLSAHPQGADSAEGVARWWLGGVEASLQEVEHALASLVRRHRVRRITLADGTSLYCTAAGEGGHGGRGRGVSS